MLLNKSIKEPIKENEIVTIRSAAGEEVIAKYLGEDAASYHLSKPLILAQGQKGMVLAPFIITAENIDFIPLLKSSVSTAPVKTQSNVKLKYIEFTTGIATSSAGTQLPPLTT